MKKRGTFLSLHSDGNVASVLDGIIKLGYDVAYGARPLRRVIQNLVEDVLAEHTARRNLGRTLRDGRWLAESLGPVLADFARYRNPAAHEAVAGRADVIRWRQRILGIGCEGVLAKLAGVGAARS